MEDNTCLKISGKKPASKECCKKLCLLAYTPSELKEILQEMENQGGYEERTRHLVGCMTNNEIKIRRSDTKQMRRRDKTTKYYVRGMEVCRQAFTVIFKITHRKVSVLRSKVESGVYRRMSGRPRKIRNRETLKNVGNLLAIDLDEKSDPECCLDEDTIVGQKNIKKEYQGNYDAGKVEAIVQYEELVDSKLGKASNLDTAGTPEDLFCGQKTKITKRGKREGGENLTEGLSVGINEEGVNRGSDDDVIVIQDGSEKKKKKKRRKDREAVEGTACGESGETAEVSLMTKNEDGKEAVENDLIVTYEGVMEGFHKHKKKKKEKNREILEEFECGETVRGKVNAVTKSESFRVEVEDDFSGTCETETEGFKKRKKKKKRKNREISEETECEKNVKDEVTVVTENESFKEGLEDDLNGICESESEGFKKHKKKKKRKNREISEEVVSGEADEVSVVTKHKSFKHALENDMIPTYEGETECFRKPKKKKKKDVCGENIEMEAVSEELPLVSKKKKKKKNRECFDLLATVDTVNDCRSEKKHNKKRKDRELGNDTLEENNNATGEDVSVPAKKRKRKHSESFTDLKHEKNLLEDEEYKSENVNEVVKKKKKKDRDVSTEKSGFNQGLAVSEECAFVLENCGKKKKKQKKSRKDCERTEDQEGVENSFLDQKETTDNHCIDAQNTQTNNQTENLVVKHKKKKKKQRGEIVSEILENPLDEKEPTKKKKKKKKEAHESGDADDPYQEVTEPKKKKKRKEDVMFSLLNDIWIV